MVPVSYFRLINQATSTVGLEGHKGSIFKEFRKA